MRFLIVALLFISFPIIAAGDEAAVELNSDDEDQIINLCSEKSKYFFDPSDPNCDPVLKILSDKLIREAEVEAESSYTTTEGIFGRPPMDVLFVINNSSDFFERWHFREFKQHQQTDQMSKHLQQLMDQMTESGVE